MAKTVLEAQAVISAVDKTGGVFASIAQKVRGLESAMRGVSNSSAKMSSAATSFAKIDKSIKGLAAAGTGTMAAHKIASVVHAVTDTYAQFDDLVRYQRAILGISKEEQAPFIKQAIEGGGATKYNDLQWLHAQLDLAQRGVQKDFILPITKMAADYGQAMNAELPEAAKTIEGILFSTRKHIEDGNEALAAAQKAVDYSVKLAKIGGLDNEDVRQFFKFAGMPGSTAGLSDETIGAMAALMRRQNIRGDEAGVAVRSIAAHLVAPTNKGRDALSAMGINYNDYVHQKDALSPARFAQFMRSRFGADMSDKMSKRVGKLLADPEVVANRDEFVTKGIETIGGLFKGKKGKLNVRDRKALAGALGDFWKYSASSVDSEKLWRALIDANPTLAQMNALFGDKQGARALAAARPEFREYYEKLKAAPEGFAKKIGDERMGGFAGAKSRFEGSTLNAETALGRTWDAELTKAYDYSAKLLQAFAEAEGGTQRFVSGLAVATAALLSIEAALKTGAMLGMWGPGVAATFGRAIPVVGGAITAGLAINEVEKQAADFRRAGYGSGRPMQTWEMPGGLGHHGEGGFYGDYQLPQYAVDLQKDVTNLRNLTFRNAESGGEPVKAELTGNASVGVTVKVEPTPDFWTKIQTMISNGIKNITVSGAPSTGTAGSTGASIPEATSGAP